MSMSGTVQASFQWQLNLMNICREQHFQQNLLQCQTPPGWIYVLTYHHFTALDTALAQDLYCDASHSKMSIPFSLA